MQNEIDIHVSDPEHSVEEPIEKPKKKKKTEKQLQAMEIARQQHLKNAQLRREKRVIEKEELNKKIQELEEQHIKSLEEKILKKALSLQRRKILENALIEKVIGIDDIPIDKLNELVKKLKIKKDKNAEVTNPLFKFV